MDEIERVIDAAYEDWLKVTGNDQKKRKHPGREEYSELFRQVYPWAVAIQKVKEGSVDEHRS